MSAETDRGEWNVTDAGLIFTASHTPASWCDGSPASLKRSLKLWDREHMKSGGGWAYGIAGDAAETVRRLRFGIPSDPAIRAHETATRELAGVTLPAPRSVRRRGAWSDLDGSPDADRALAGSDRPYRIRMKMPRGPRIVSIGWQSAALMEASEAAFAQIAAKLTATVNALESAGYAVEVSAIFASNVPRSEGSASFAPRTVAARAGRGDARLFAAHRVIVKAANEPLDERGALAWGLTGSFRYLAFGHRTADLYDSTFNIGDPPGWRSLGRNVVSDEHAAMQEIARLYGLSAVLWQENYSATDFCRAVVSAVDAASPDAVEIAS